MCHVSEKESRGRRYSELLSQIGVDGLRLQLNDMGVLHVRVSGYSAIKYITAYHNRKASLILNNSLTIPGSYSVDTNP